MENEEIEQNTTVTKVLKEKRFRNYNWTDAEVRALMKAWWEHHEDFKSTKGGCSRRPLYDKISFDIRRYGYQRTRTEAQTKLQNLLKIYRKERELLKRTGEKSKWRYYNLVKHIVDADPQEMDNSIHDYLSSDPDSLDIETDAGSSSAHIIKLTNSVGSDSDNPSFLNYDSTMTDSQDTPEKDLSFNSSPLKKKQENIEDVLSAFLSEFKRSNAQLEKNDQEIMGLLKENNELCKQQIELLTLFLNK